MATLISGIYSRAFCDGSQRQGWLGTYEARNSDSSTRTACTSSCFVIVRGTFATNGFASSGMACSFSMRSAAVSGAEGVVVSDKQYLKPPQHVPQRDSPDGKPPVIALSPPR